MVAWTYMKKSSEPVPADKSGLESWALHDLEFPVNPDFDSRPPRIDPQLMLKRCAETMPWRNSRPGERERRLAEKIPVEFVL